MSTVFLHVGQCGNQLGRSFWQEVEEWYGSPHSEIHPRSAAPYKVQRARPNNKLGSNPQQTTARSPAFSLLDGTLPCVLVDTETKVVRKCTGQRAPLGNRVPPKFRVIERGGRGNNWAYGYFSAVGREVKSGRGIGGFEIGSTEEGKCLQGSVQECVRRLVEKCDRFGGFLQLHSIAGGTGSGVGSAIVEQLRDDYPLSYIISVAVAPFSHGETPLQHYNSLFSLHHLQSHSDCIVLFQNDHVLAQALRTPTAATAPRSVSTGGSSDCGGVSVEDMNKQISNMLCNTLLPLWSPKHKAPAVSGGEPWELVRSVCPDPAMKLALPFHCQLTRPTQSWDNALSVITSSYRAAVTNTEAAPGSGTMTTTKPHTSSLVTICRGNPSAMTSLVSNTSTIEKRLKQVFNTVPWNPFPVDLWLSYEPHLRDRKTVSVLANSAAVSGYLNSLVERGRVMHREGAYIHWFERYGCDQAMFEEAFETVDKVIENYSRLSA